MRRTLPVFSRVAAVVAAVLVGFPLLQDYARSLEIGVAVDVLGWLGKADNVTQVYHGAVLAPGEAPVFAAALTPSCSAIAALIALAALGAVTKAGSPGRRVVALGSALAIVAIGNMIRIVTSLLVGLWLGRSSLILFHDVVGATMTYIYILGGYIFMLTVLIDPSDPSRRWIGSPAAHPAMEPQRA